MFKNIQALLDDCSGKNLYQKVNRRRLLLTTIGSFLFATGLAVKNIELQKSNVTKGYGSNSYGA